MLLLLFSFHRMHDWLSKMKKLTSRCTISLAVCFWIFSLGNAPADPLEGGSASLDLIQTKVTQFLKRPGVRSAQWGIEVLDPESGKVLFSVNPDRAFQPASVLKVVTTAAALEKLGPDYRFHTGVYTDGFLRPDGILEGNLILVGRGDPNLADPEGDLLAKPALEELAEKIEARGIKGISGHIIGDDSYFESATHGEGWTARDLRSPYGAPINALSIDDNVFWLHARPTRVGRAVGVRIAPPTSYFKIRNLGVTRKARTRSTLSVRIAEDTNRLTVSGGLPSNKYYSRFLILERPAEATATLFMEELERRGIKAGGEVGTVHRGDVSAEDHRKWTLLADHESPPLIRALEHMNKHSVNLHAEMLLRVLGAEFGGAGTDDAGVRVVRRFLIDAGIDIDGVILKDGSGLSRENLLTPRFQTSLLLYLSNRSYFHLFVNTLAVSGTDGTLKHRLNSRPVRGSIHAKTGTLKDVASLSGYMTTKSGRNLVFSIFVNQVHTSMWRIRRTIDEICTLFVKLY